MMSEVQVGKLTGHSAAVNMCLGFIPAAIIFINLTDPGFGFWTRDFATGDVFHHTDGTSSVETTNGVDVYEGGDEPDGTDAYQDATGTALTIFSTSGQVTEQGFTLGTLADLNTDGEAVKFIAMGRSPQSPA